MLARSQERLDALAAQLRTEFGVEVRAASVDLSGPEVGTRVAAIADGCDVGMLIVNAGARNHYGDLVDDPLEVTVREIQLTCLAPAVLCRIFGAPMAARGRGGIILLGSVSGYGGAAGMAVYSAGKAFDAKLAESLWMEMGPRGVHVLGLIAGATDTPAMARAGLDLSGFSPMRSADVAAEGLAHLADGPIWVAGDENRAAADHLRSLSPADAAMAMSAGSAASFGKVR